MLSGLIDYLKSFYDWLVGYVKEPLDDLLMPFAEKVPDLSYSYDFMFSYLSFINKWIALDWGVALLSAYFGFFLCYLVVRIVKSFIPTISG